MSHPSLLEILLIGLLATYRITLLLKVAQPGESEESGPKDILTKWRHWVGVRYDEHTRPYGTSWRAEILLCFLCLSIWIAFGVGALVVIGLLAGRVEIALGILFPFALSGGSVYLKKAVG